MSKQNLDVRTVNSFGDEWSAFDQNRLKVTEAAKIFSEYFEIFPWDSLPSGAEGFDMGCGSGRWAKFVAPRVGTLHCIDPSDAIEVAKKNLAELDNITFIRGSLDETGLNPESQDFGYSLGVLHHVPDTAAAIRSCAELLKVGAPLLLYLYYSFENRPIWYRILWKISDFVRKLVYRMPNRAKRIFTDLIALLVYLPLAQLSRFLEFIGFEVHEIPLSYYRKHTLYTMRTDARDRFGTPLEQRFTRNQIIEMMTAAGLVNIRFSEGLPYWRVVGTKGR